MNKLPGHLKWQVYSSPFLRNRLRIDFFQTRRRLLSSASKLIIIGANDGFSFDDLFQNLNPDFVSGLVIEPSKKYFSILRQNLVKFKNVEFLNVAITHSNSYFSLYQLNEQGLGKLPDWGKGLGSLSKQNLLKFDEISEMDIEVEEVKGLTFDKIIEDYSLTNVDYLQIDTEGFDGKIIRMIDFEIFTSQLIKFEWVNLAQSELEECKLTLVNNGYHISVLGGDVVAYSRDLSIFFY
ncbi:FkbM family methyltransferase [Algoriphagus sp. H41]|uniref:FkbM family methyltransferase n=1 Tax=Algoriphagus oliviformis TaxID=2811231 RepID=A0ABS3C766_9BACT|nr:FkbM family methyltransferase [Algoriphagus oliviformis]MBN7812946.1 FkbM family methyltransferase [Algoriphagus oliviformis]